MLLYVTSFLALAAVPLALGAYGGHLAAEVISDRKHRRNAMFIVWSLASVGVVLAGVQQIMTYKADRQHEKQQEESEHRHKEEQSDLRSQLETSMQRQEYMRGQLDSIGVMVGKLGEGRSDPSLTKLAEAIGRVTRTPIGGGQALGEPRRLSETRRSQLAALLRSGAGRRVVIYVPSPVSERDRRERQDYAKDLQLAFEEARWRVIPRYSNDADLNDYTGLLLVYDKGNPPESWPDFTLLKRALNSAEVSYSVAGLDPMDIYQEGATTADPVIYIGER